MRQSGRTEHLTSALRAIASQAAGVTQGCALLFAAMPGDDAPEANTRLRAAAGFSSADGAKRAAEAATETVRAAISGGAAQETHGLPLGSRGDGDVHVVPLQFEGRTHGALAAAAPGAIDGATAEAIVGLARSAAVHLDHIATLETLDEQPNPTASRAGPGNADELLKLSEELFAQDIQLLRSNEKLGKIEKLKNDFIEKMSLELRTPLNSIIEATISVLAGEHDALSEGARQTLRNALDEGTSFQRTLQNILDLWRIKQGELPLEMQEVSFAEVVEEAIFSIQETLDAKQIRMERALQEPVPKVVTDLAKTNQIVFLLLENAAKFTKQGQITITASVEKDMLHCSIADTGIGICPDDQELIFDEFFQVDDFSSQSYRGAGLGLTLVRDLLVLLEGDCTVESEPGRGTTVSFSIPVQIA
jgi:signal transduction histidine kinase